MPQQKLPIVLTCLSSPVIAFNMHACLVLLLLLASLFMALAQTSYDALPVVNLAYEIHQASYLNVSTVSSL